MERDQKIHTLTRDGRDEKITELETAGKSMLNIKNSIRDARTPQPGEIVFNTMKYRSSKTVQRSVYFQSSVSYIKAKMMFK